MASKLVFLIFSIYLSLVYSAFLPFEGLPLNRAARSPHCWSCEQEGGYPPPHYYGFHHHPNFRSQQWSGLSQSPDGSQQQVFSGAAASAGEGGRSSGDSEAFSIASSGSGGSKTQGVKGSNDAQNSYSNKVDGTKIEAGNQQQQLEATKDSWKQHTQNIGNSEYGKVSSNTGNGNQDLQQQTAGPQTSQNILPGFAKTSENTQSSSGRGDNGSTKTSQYGVEHHELQNGGNEGGFDNGSAQTKYHTDFINNEHQLQRPAGSNYGNAKYTSDVKNFGSQQDLQRPDASKGNEQTQNGFSQSKSLSSNGYESHGQDYNQKSSYNADNNQQQQNLLQDSSNLDTQSSLYGGNGYKGKSDGYNGQQQQSLQVSSHDDQAQYSTNQGFNQKSNRYNSQQQHQNLLQDSSNQGQAQYLANQGKSNAYNGQEQQQQYQKLHQDSLNHDTQSLVHQANSQESNNNAQPQEESSVQSSTNQGSRASLTGALSLANQGLEASRKIPESDCTDCAGKGSVAYSNARSHSGNAVALSIGG